MPPEGDFICFFIASESWCQQLFTSDLECQRVKYFIKMIENISLQAYLVPESVEHDGVETDNENQRQEVAENKETSLIDYNGVRVGRKSLRFRLNQTGPPPCLGSSPRNCWSQLS